MNLQWTFNEPPKNLQWTFNEPSMKLWWTLGWPWIVFGWSLEGPLHDLWVMLLLNDFLFIRTFGIKEKAFWLLSLKIRFCWDIFCIILWNWHLMLCCCFLLLFPASAVIGEKGVWKFRWYHIKSLRNTNEIRVHYFQREKKAAASILFRKLF